MPTRRSSSSSATSSSSSAASTLRGGGKGQSQKRFCNFFCFFGMMLLWDDINNISKEGSKGNF